ncbi:OmpA/MotB family protein [Leifsonia sp. Leaf264]|uniref:OmpA/MotB family protein n=1 Tax=Leifsonia sp. Leaf264 TaxID=1736314 RepID=UPI0009E892B5|nr:flagellar motor protein MotB [Leifsonia sp. Leaf264]
MSKRKKRGGGDVEHHIDERWAISYMDMVTVLMCLFIVLFAMSSPDAEKYEKLKDSLATGFGTEQSETVDVAEGIIVPPELEGEDENLTNIDIAKKELATLKAIRDHINSNLTAQGNQNAVSYKIDERGLTVSLVGAETFFQGGSTDLSAKAVDILNAIGPVVAPIKNQLSVEGHADPHGSSAPFPTDWELSSGRSTQVVRFFTERQGVAANRLAAIGYSSARPVTQDASPAGQQQNRRVDIVILSDKTDAVRALIPGLLAAETDPAKAAEMKAEAEKEAAELKGAHEAADKLEKSTKKAEKKKSGGH